jgi:protein ImuB
MAVHFPRLPLEALRIHPDDRESLAIMEGEGSKAVIVDCTKGAEGDGVRPSMALSAALMLSPQLQSKQRDVVREQAALLKLAEIGYGFTPTVSLESPNSLLLEVEGSAHLFGGITPVRHRARDAFKDVGFAAVTSLAPTPVAALWLAYARQSVSITRSEEIRSVLGRLPVHAIFGSADLLDSFDRLGVKYLVDLFRLPREGLARRFGKDFLRTLDRATGDQPDPRTAWTRPKQLKLHRELPGELIQMAHLEPYIEDMVVEFVRELRRHDAGVDRVKILFKHFQQPATTVTIGSAAPHRDEERWKLLIQNRLANQILIAPALEVQLLSSRFKRYTAQSQDLLGIGKTVSEGMGQLVDLLRARLGRTSIFGVVATQDARPEQAWRVAEPGEELKQPRSTKARPIHILPAPTLLGGRLRYRGATLKIVKGPERIEGGWWAKEAWTRDYYQVVSSRGEKLWVFHQQKQWYLHGLFS